ncbi:putative E3 ubiquitin-protein ligase rbrA, partial [Cucurbita argyrosperma subsp. argyrosperma]
MWTPADQTSQNPDGEDLNAIVSVQLRDLMDALALDSDHEFSYKVPIEEALDASLASSASSFTPQPEFQEFEGNDSTTIGTLHSSEIGECDQIFQEWLQSAFDTRRTHDSGEILNIPDGDLSEREYSIEKSFGEGSSKSEVNQGVSSLYFKGLVSEEGIGIGVAICNPKNELVFEVKRRLVGNERSKMVAECKALIAGLNAAIDLELKQLCFYCDYYPLYQFVTGRWLPKQRKVAALFRQITHLQAHFDSCYPRLVARHDIKFAFKLAREAIVPQITQTEDPVPKKLNETCVICLEDCDVNRMFAVDGCLHRYCFSCMKQHMEVKLLQGLVPKCPHEGCMIDLNVDSCTKFLTPKDMATMRQHLKEASIPVSEKVYCPYPKCSALTTKGEALEYTKDVLGSANQSGLRKCMKCHGLFCINCKVPWHNLVSCRDYKGSSNLELDDVKLKSLASTCLWRQCVKCNHMIELAEDAVTSFAINVERNGKLKRRRVLARSGVRIVSGIMIIIGNWILMLYT